MFCGPRRRSTTGFMNYCGTPGCSKKSWCSDSITRSARAAIGSPAANVRRSLWPAQFVKRPQTLLLDEATANLDEISQRCVTDLLQHDFADQTVVAVSHRLATVRDCGQILVLDQGQIVQRGIYDQLATTPGLFQQLIQQEAGVPFTAGTPAIPTTGPSTTDREVLRGLTACSLFAELTSECLTILARSARIQSCPKGAVLFERGDVGEELYVILAGEVEFFVRATDAPERVETVEVYGAGLRIWRTGPPGRRPADPWRPRPQRPTTLPPAAIRPADGAGERTPRRDRTPANAGPAVGAPARRTVRRRRE